VQPFAHEALGTHRRQHTVERQRQRRVGAERLEQVHALRNGGEQERRGVGPEQPRGMRIEGRDQRRPALGARPLDRPADHRLMADMETVEIAERHDRAPCEGGNHLVPGKPYHGRAL
jgi:hypothetical protein